ncbi:MAG: hypothetical protein Q9203_000693 [Teloschistes exilis]
MIQAKSLSSVVELADNPPASSHLNQAADVFLTTAKPLQKVVTAQDVQSSLYYIHVDSQDDERLREDFSGFLICDHGWEVTESYGASDIDRRTVSEREVLWHRSDYTIASQQGVSSDSQCGPSPNPSQNIAQIVRKPVASHVQHGVETSPTKPGLPIARIIGPRAMGQHIQPLNNPGTPSAYGKENLAPTTRSAQSETARSLSPERTQRLESSTISNHSRVDANSNGTSWKPPFIGSEQFYYGKPNEPGPMITSKEDCPSLTLIRRYDGSQKNVGRILNDFSAHHKEATQAILINTPGYSGFQSRSATRLPVSQGPVFECSLGKLRRHSQSPESGQTNAHGHNNRTSRMSIDFRRMGRPHFEETSDQQKSPAYPEDLKSGSIKGYGFLSPWNGICEFNSGFTGQTLKCKHTSSTPGSQAVTVSELRFNLPSSSTAGVASPRILRSPDRPTTAKRASYFSSRHKSESSVGEDHAQRLQIEDPMDSPTLSLGREKAGGGFGGKQAKLGKLIVEAEGLKMLDLVVAANMGVWWKAYEKSA